MKEVTTLEKVFKNASDDKMWIESERKFSREARFQAH